MYTTPAGVRFTVIGENIHATRTRSLTGRHVIEAADGSRVVAFTDSNGTPRTMPISATVAASADFASGRVKHVRNALLLALRGAGVIGDDRSGPVSRTEAGLGADYLVAMAVQQAVAGADYLDVNVDEIDQDLGIRTAAMAWLVGHLEGRPEVGLPLSVDSSSPEVIGAGLRASVAPHGPLLVNSASLDRIEALDLAAEHGSAVVLGAAGPASLPSSADERIANARLIIAEATSRGLGLDRLHLDALVMPAAVDPSAGPGFLDAARALRAEYGPELHITGGLSNVSFGLPARRLLNDAFIRLAVDAGVDSGILDPIANNFGRIFGLERQERGMTLAAAFLTGQDEYGMEYLAAFRAGELGTPS